MGLLEGFVAIPPAVLLNYVTMGLAGVAVTYHNLSLIFERRRVPVLWWTYFLAKNVVDACLYYGSGSSSGTADIVVLWSQVMAVVSLFVVVHTFRGDYVQVGLCALVSDVLAAALVTLFYTLNNLSLGRPYDGGYLVPISPGTFAYAALMLGTAHLLRVPVSGILRHLCRVALRDRRLWLGIVLVSIAGAAYLSSRAGAMLYDAEHRNFYDVYAYYMLVIVLMLVLQLAQRRRDVVRRERAMASSVELARSYDNEVRAQLATLERGRTALEGHELALRRLGQEADDQTLAQRVTHLERTYRRLSAGNYCAQPALDAVLTSCAARLAAHGVDPAFTVAGVPMRMVVPTGMVLTLLNLALDAAERTASVEGSQADLRIRAMGEQLFLRLDVPARWGAIGARRFLAPYGRDRAVAVRERRQGDRTLVLVVAEVSGS